MLAAILSVLKLILESLPILDRWFNKTPVEKKDDVEKSVQDEKEEFKKKGRPKWE